MSRPTQKKRAAKKPTAAPKRKGAPEGAAPRGPGRPPRHGAQAAGPETSYPPSARVIKRYGNRRLYDAQLSRCVTMSEIADMVRAREDVRIVDGDNGEDLTKRVLVQIILEQQNSAQLELLPVELLHQIIAVRSAPVAGWLGQYLQAGAEFLERQSKAAAPAMRGVSDSLGNLFPWLNPDSWKNTPGAADMASAFASAAAQAAPASSTAPPEGESSMQRELAELQRRFADLTSRFGRT